MLGNGFSVIPVQSTYIIQAVPGELTLDHTTVLQSAQVCHPLDPLCCLVVIVVLVDWNIRD